MPRAIEGEVKNKMRPELEIVLCSVRTKSPKSEERLKALFGAGVNWSEMLACAIEHKLAPSLYERIRALDAALLAQDQRETLAELARSTGRNNLAYLSEMLRLHGLFEAAQIPAIPFKGPALAWLAYPNFTHRTCVDLDFVVPQRYIPEAMSLLQAHGYTPQFSPVEAQAGQHGPAPGEYAFAPTGKRSFVELHTERTLRYFSRPLNLEEMNSRLVHLEIGGQNLRTFSVEDLLVMLCVHGAKHFWERLAWIVDIAQLITVCDVDWTLLSEIAAKMESTRLLLLGVYLAHEVVGASLPQSVLERARGDAQVQWLAGKVLEQYEENSDPSVGVLPRAVFRLRSCDGYWQGLRQLFRLSLSPTESDRQTMQLPGFLSPLYTLVRPFRLLREYGLGLNRRVKPDLAIYQPTPQEIVDQMLRLADISPGDVLYDLGCGDGRIVVTAAEKYGIRAVGVDINPTRIAQARANGRRHRVEKRVQFILGDAKKADFREATVITMFLGADGNLRLADRLRANLRSGARIVSRDFLIYGWAPERIENRIMSNGVPTSLYLWTIKKAEKETPAEEDAVPELRQTHKAEG
ncbi:MAG: nucleotidyltransferase family protein [Candidatus Acidiferrales bacterium]